MKRMFLIDYENVTRSGLEGVESLTSVDTVVVFYNSTSTIPIDLLVKINKSEASFDWIGLKIPGLNALDLQLTTFLGETISKVRLEDDYTVFIVSKDNGYDSAIKMAFERFGVLVSKAQSISSCKDYTQNKFDNELYNSIASVLKENRYYEFLSYTGLIENSVLTSKGYKDVLQNKINCLPKKLISLISDKFCLKEKESVIENKVEVCIERVPDEEVLDFKDTSIFDVNAIKPSQISLLMHENLKRKFLKFKEDGATEFSMVLVSKCKSFKINYETNYKEVCYPVTTKKYGLSIQVSLQFIKQLRDVNEDAFNKLLRRLSNKHRV